MDAAKRIYPGGQPYTPPRDLTEEEKKQVLQYLKGKEGGTADGERRLLCDCLSGPEIPL